MDGVAEIRYFLKGMYYLLVFPLFLENRKPRKGRVASFRGLKLPGVISFAMC